MAVAAHPGKGIAVRPKGFALRSNLLAVVLTEVDGADKEPREGCAWFGGHLRASGNMGWSSNFRFKRQASRQGSFSQPFNPKPKH
jgi:hypothetical protein